MLLAHLDRNGTVEVVARIELQTLLVGINVQLNTSDVGIHCKDTDICGFWRRVPRAIEDEGIVIAGAVEPAVINRVENISSDLFWRGEIERRAVNDADRAIRHFNIVDLHITGRVGHVECVIQDRHIGRVGETVEVPVDVVRKHDGGWFIDRYRHKSGSPCRTRRYCVGRVCDDGARKAFISSVEERKGDRTHVA